MIEMWLDPVSTYAWQIDYLVWLITLLVGLCFFIAEGIFFFWIFKFRAKDGRKAQYIPVMRITRSIGCISRTTGCWPST